MHCTMTLMLQCSTISQHPDTSITSASHHIRARTATRLAHLAGYAYVVIYHTDHYGGSGKRVGGAHGRERFAYLSHVCGPRRAASLRAMEIVHTKATYIWRSKWRCVKRCLLWRSTMNTACVPELTKADAESPFAAFLSGRRQNANTLLAASTSDAGESAVSDNNNWLLLRNYLAWDLFTWSLSHLWRRFFFVIPKVSVIVSGKTHFEQRNRDPENNSFLT